MTDRTIHMEETQELIKIGAVLKMVPLSRSAIYAEIKNGTFPRQKRLTARSVAWVRREIEEWIVALPLK